MSEEESVHREPEEWRPVPDAPGYTASNLGRIHGPRKPCKGTPDHGGYLRVGTHTGTRRTSIHSMVMSAFVGPRPPGFHIDHIDGNKTNNALSNLRYVTQSENEHNKKAHGTTYRGTRGAAAKLTPEQVLEIRAAYVPRVVSGAALAAKYGVTIGTISHIVTRKAWAWL